MSKTEMVNRMIILGCIQEVEREKLLKHSSHNVLKIYIDKVSQKVIERRN